MVGPVGFEPTTNRLWAGRSAAELRAPIGAGDGIRTRDTLLGRQELYRWATPASALKPIAVQV